MSTYLAHHGVKGQKWGVRRYQYADGTLTHAGKKRYSTNEGSEKRVNVSISMNMRMSEFSNKVRTQITGKQYVDGYIKSGTTLSRIQTAKNFENFAFYATYKKHDMNEYMGLFGRNLIDRAASDAKRAEKLAKASGSEDDFATAKNLRDKADNIKVYQLKIDAMKKLKIPSDENASDITAKLLKDSDFRNNLEASIQDSKEKMRRPAQQILFNQAQKALRKDIDKLTASEKVSIYKAFNLSLVNHNPQEIAAQDRFYGELKKKGYNALLDYNDKEFSSYHAKRPMIVFDTDAVKLRSVTEANPKVVNRLYTIYNTERILKEIPAETFGLVGRYGKKTVTDCYSYMDRRMNEYLTS